MADISVTINPPQQVSASINPPNQTDVTIGEGIPKHAITHAPGGSDSLAAYYATTGDLAYVSGLTTGIGETGYLSGYVTTGSTGIFITGSVVRPSETGAFLTTGAADSRYALQSETGNFVTNTQTGSFLTTGAGDIRYVHTTGDIVSGQIHISGGIATGNQTNLVLSQTWSGQTTGTLFTGINVNISGLTHANKSALANFSYNGQDILQIIKVSGGYSGAITFGSSSQSPALIHVPSNAGRAPTIAIGTNVGDGIVQEFGGNIVTNFGNGNGVALRGGQGIDMGGTATIAWQNGSSPLQNTQDTYIGRQAAGIIRFGNNGTTRVDQTITAHHVTSASGTGASLILTAGTGSGVAGVTGEVRISGRAIALNVRPTVNNTGVLLSGEALLLTQTGQFVSTGATGNFIVSSQTGNFITTSQTGVFVNSGSTGNFITNDQTGYYTGIFYPYSSNPLGYVQGAVVRPSQTGAFLTTGAADGRYALQSATGSFITTGQTGQFVSSGSTGNFVTGSVVRPSETGAFLTTGAGDNRYALQSATGSFVTTGQTGQFVTGSVVRPSETGAFLTTGAADGRYALQSATGNFVTTGQTGAFLTTGAADGRYALQSATGSFVTTGQTGQFVTGSVVRPSETGNFITTSQTGAFAAAAQTGAFLTTGAADGRYALQSATGSFITTGQTGQFVSTGSTGNFVTTSQTGIFATQSNLNIISGTANSGYNSSITGIQISGDSTKTIFLYPRSGQAISGSFVDNGGGAGNTGELTGVFYPLNSNPSGYITGVDLSSYATTGYVTGVSGHLQGQITSLNNQTGSYVTGSVVRPSETGVFITTGQTGQFYPVSNPSGFLVSGSPVDLVHLYAKNDQGVTIYRGQPVYIVGANGSNPLIKVASNTGEFSSSKTIGLLAQDLLVNEFGYVVTEGILEGFDTSSGNAGDPMWLGPTGNILYGTGNKPYGLNNLVYLGVVLRSQSNNGKVYVQIQNGFEIEELHNVYALNPSNKDALLYNSASGAWFARQMTTGDVSGINNYALKSETGSFITTSQTGQFVSTGATGNFVTNNQTGAFLTTGAADGRYALQSATGNFVTTGQTGQFVTGSVVRPSETGAFLTTGAGDGRYALQSATGSFVTTGQTGAFAAAAGTGAFLTTGAADGRYALKSATGSFVTTGQTGTFITTSQTGQFVATGQTGFLGKTAIGITIDGAGSAITAGSKGSISIPYNCTLDSATVVADQVGSIVIDIKKSTYASFPTTSSIVGAGTKPTLSSAQKYTDSSLTNWTKTISAGDVLEYVVDSASTVTKVTLTLGATKYN